MHSCTSSLTDLRTVVHPVSQFYAQFYIQSHSSTHSSTSSITVLRTVLHPVNVEKKYHNMLKTLLFLASLAPLALAELELGVCPEYTTKEDFEIPPYVGRWFEIERFDTGFQLDMICVTADYAAVADNAISVTNSGNVLGQLVQIQGNATATEIPGQLDLYFPNNDPGVYNVLATDYETASCIYSCEQIGEYMQEYGWLLSRTQTLGEDVIVTVEECFTQFGIDLSKFKRTEQGGDCVYAPEPEN